MSVRLKLETILALLILVSDVTCGSFEKNDIRMDTMDSSSSKRTFLMSKLFVISTLAAIGLKFLLILPVFFTKIALLGIMNFISSNLNLLISTLMGYKDYEKGYRPFYKPQEESHMTEYLMPVNLFSKYQPQHAQHAVSSEHNRDGKKTFHQPGGASNNLGYSRYEDGTRFQSQQGERFLPDVSGIYGAPDRNSEGIMDESLGKYKCTWIWSTQKPPLRRKYLGSFQANRNRKINTLFHSTILQPTREFKNDSLLESEKELITTTPTNLSDGNEEKEFQLNQEVQSQAGYTVGQTDQRENLNFINNLQLMGLAKRIKK